MLSMETWSEYVRRVSSPLTQTQISERCGVAQTNIGRWLRGDPGLPRAESVVAFARAFEQPVIEALVAAGYITPDEVGISFVPHKGRTSIREFSTEELFAELRRRTITD